MNTNKKKCLRVGIIGLGAISNNHIRSLLSLDGVNLCAVCDIVPERIVKKVVEHNLSVNTYTDYKEMIAREELDAVHILTPHFLHAPMSVYALLHKGGIAMNANQFFYYFFYFAKGCPAFVRSER